MPEDLPAKAELTQVPFFPQSEYQCGPAALATVLNYRHQSVKPDDLTDKVYVPNRKGSFQLEMVAAARQYGLVAYPLAPKMSDLLSEVSAGNPVLVLQNLSFDTFPMWHFSVVVGYDLAHESIVLRSATTKRWETSFSNFEQTWRKSQYWGLVITQPNHIPKTANVKNWLQASYDLEQVGKIQAAKVAYQAATKHWLDQPDVWIALTNLQYKQKDFAEAISNMKSILPRFSSNVQLWNNYAYILKSYGCQDAAILAAKCGVKAAPNDENIKSTLLDMQKTDAIQLGAKKCPVISCFQ
ncbi:PA2778 family cysteine peptidase [Hydrogenovibrio kuenenii]|uniref:PA2778 family cysteine peptidase n=1 Tax=Hydrogenovibrio kuenenii TaxID=63658 RepID=UPI0004AF7FA4|nr:PA2778 family cysteine peptidase [Hydrogenovibrio kuenenii]